MNVHNKSNKLDYVLSLVFVLCSLSCVAQSTSVTVQLPVDTILPITNISQLENLQNFNKIKHRPGNQTIVVYTFRGCKPCAVLAKEINLNIIKGKLDSNDVVFINPYVRDSSILVSYIQQHKYQSPYYILPIMSKVDIKSYPFIVAHNTQGIRVWDETGMGFGVYRKIKKHLRSKP